DGTNVVVDGNVVGSGADSPDDKTITPQYFTVFRVPLVAGRLFTAADAAPGAPPVVILNDVAASRYFPGRNPLGATIGIGRAQGEPLTIVGVVRSMRLQAREAEVRPEIYRPLDLRQPLSSPVVTLVLRTARDPGTLAASVRAAIQSAAADLI